MLVCHRCGSEWRASARSSMQIVKPRIPGREPASDYEQKQAALSYLHEAWEEARLDGVEDDCMAQACLFAAFADMVATYGEDAAAKFADGLAQRVRNGDFSVQLLRQ